MTIGISKERLEAIYSDELKDGNQMKCYAYEYLLNYVCKELNPWLPIESAPKDRRILLLYEGNQRIAGQWDSDEYTKKPQPHWACDYRFLWGRTVTKSRQPTHWQELPEPPK